MTSICIKLQKPRPFDWWFSLFSAFECHSCVV